MTEPPRQTPASNPPVRWQNIALAALVVLLVFTFLREIVGWGTGSERVGVGVATFVLAGMSFYAQPTTGHEQSRVRRGLKAAALAGVAVALLFFIKALKS